MDFMIIWAANAAMTWARLPREAGAWEGKCRETPTLNQSCPELRNRGENSKQEENQQGSVSWIDTKSISEETVEQNAAGRSHTMRTQTRLSGRHTWRSFVATVRDVWID